MVKPFLVSPLPENPQPLLPPPTSKYMPLHPIHSHLLSPWFPFIGVSIEPSPDQGPLLPLMPNKAFLCRIFAFLAGTMCTLGWWVSPWESWGHLGGRSFYSDCDSNSTNVLLWVITRTKACSVVCLVTSFVQPSLFPGKNTNTGYQIKSLKYTLIEIWGKSVNIIILTWPPNRSLVRCGPCPGNNG